MRSMCPVLLHEPLTGTYFAALAVMVLGTALVIADTAAHSHAHDGDGTRYIVLLDDGYPVATCRFYALGEDAAMLGRVVVLPEYRGQGLGLRTVTEAEIWMQELGYRTVVVEARTEAVGFYEKLGYTATDGTVIRSGQFDCVRMEKEL